jgi:hypothetical protein
MLLNLIVQMVLGLVDFVIGLVPKIDFGVDMKVFSALKGIFGFLGWFLNLKVVFGFVTAYVGLRVGFMLVKAIVHVWGLVKP